jgi:hypothetical protein
MGASAGRPVTAGEDREGRKAMHASEEDFTQLDDPAFLAERRRVRQTIEALTERYEALTAEFDRRATAKWTAEVR